MEGHTFGAETLVEKRQALMYSPCGANATLRNAHFLNPIFSENHTHLPSPPSPSPTLPTSENLKKYSFRSYKTYPSEKWKTWGDSLKPKYQDIWKQAGIYDAILASMYKIPNDKDLIFGLAERWCPETNTFMFPWGEVTITLEDVMFLGGYSVLGAFHLTPLAGECVGIFDSLIKAYKEIKLLVGNTFNALRWMEYFMCNGKEFEHEAFLAMWLSRFVLVRSDGNIIMGDFHVAIHLSRGNRIALAPAVLASIYRDMRLLRNSIVESSISDSKGLSRLNLCHTDIVHMWVWERFPKLRPTPSVLEGTEPRSAQWNGVKILKGRDVRADLDSGKQSFIWCPYVITPSNCMLSKLYRDDEQWVVVECDATESFARCLRVSELVGLDYIEHYLPHRVAMQFGLDQDVPTPCVVLSSESPKTAWSSYNRCIRGMELYIPPRLFQSDVSSRYVVWWRGLQPVNEEMVTTCSQNEELPLSSCGRAKSLTPPSCLSARTYDYVEHDNLTIAEPDSCSRKTLSKRTKISGKGIVLDNSLVLNTHTEIKIPAKLISMNEPVKSNMQSKSSSDKCKESKSCTERLTSPKEEAVVGSSNHAEVTTVGIKLSKDEVVSKANCPENNILNIEGESCDNTTSELTQSGLMARILRLEKIVDDIKAAKHDAGSWRKSE